jgi:hypothetical protein
MKRYLLSFLLVIGFSSCYVYDEVRVNSAPQPRFYWDPIYGYPHYYYTRPQTIIVVPRQPKVRVIQEPRRNAFGPTAPPSAPRGPRPQQAPIRTFPKRDDKK